MLKIDIFFERNSESYHRKLWSCFH